MIKNFWPQNTNETIYIERNLTLSEIIDVCKEHFGDKFDEEKIKISSEYIHTNCITYDLYDSSDYTNFIVVELT